MPSLVDGVEPKYPVAQSCWAGFATPQDCQHLWAHVHLRRPFHSRFDLSPTPCAIHIWKKSFSVFVLADCRSR